MIGILRGSRRMTLRQTQPLGLCPPSGVVNPIDGSFAVRVVRQRSLPNTTLRPSAAIASQRYPLARGLVAYVPGPPDRHHSLLWTALLNCFFSDCPVPLVLSQLHDIGNQVDYSSLAGSKSTRLGKQMKGWVPLIRGRLDYSSPDSQHPFLGISSSNGTAARQVGSAVLGALSATFLRVNSWVGHLRLGRLICPAGLKACARS